MAAPPTASATNPIQQATTETWSTDVPVREAERTEPAYSPNEPWSTTTTPPPLILSAVEGPESASSPNPDGSRTGYLWGEEIAVFDVDEPEVVGQPSVAAQNASSVSATRPPTPAFAPASPTTTNRAATEGRPTTSGPGLGVATETALPPGEGQFEASRRRASNGMGPSDALTEASRPDLSLRDIRRLVDALPSPRPGGSGGSHAGKNGQT